MSKLTGAALDRAVANALGLKSVNNCEKWRTTHEQRRSTETCQVVECDGVVGVQPNEPDTRLLDRGRRHSNAGTGTNHLEGEG